MNFRSYLQFVFDQIRQHPIRFPLTISGIVVGVASLTLLASLLTVGRAVLRQTNSRASGDDLINITNDWSMMKQHPEELRLSERDVAALRRAPSLKNVTFTAEYARRLRYTFEGKDDKVRCVGLSPQAFEANQLQIARGRAFLESEYDDLSRVAIVGSSLLADHPRPWLGKWLDIEGYKVLIVGVLKRKPTIGPGKEFSWNNRIILPAETFIAFFNPKRTPDGILGRVVPHDMTESLENALSAAQSIVEAILLQPRHFKNFRLRGTGERDSNEKTILLVIQILMISTTILSMIVGGINIMNIMLVTVTERTREIGIRRAIGADKRAILTQFLLEAILIAGTGAFVGLGLALILLKVASIVITRVYYTWPFYVATWSVFLAIGLTLVIGILAGLSPAIKAARLDPVEALRFE